jgi:hypothetical protein
VLNSPFLQKTDLLKIAHHLGRGIRSARNYVQLRENLIHRVRDIIIHHAGKYAHHHVLDMFTAILEICSSLS